MPGFETDGCRISDRICRDASAWFQPSARLRLEMGSTRIQQQLCPDLTNETVQLCFYMKSHLVELANALLSQLPQRLAGTTES